MKEGSITNNKVAAFWGRIGLDEKVVKKYLDEQTRQLTEVIQNNGTVLTEETRQICSEIISDAVLQYVTAAKEGQADLEQTVQKNFKALKTNQAAFTSQIMAQINELKKTAGELEAVLSMIRDKYAEEAQEQYGKGEETGSEQIRANSAEAKAARKAEAEEKHKVEGGGQRKVEDSHKSSKGSRGKRLREHLISELYRDSVEMELEEEERRKVAEAVRMAEAEKKRKEYLAQFQIVEGELKKYVGHAKEVVIPSGVTSIGSFAFNGCSGLVSIVIPDSVTSIGSLAFSGCRGLVSIVIPDSVTSIGSLAFNCCSGLMSVTIGSGVTSLGDSVFASCRGLTSIVIPDSVTDVGEYAFRDCDGLTSITIPRSVLLMGDGVFWGCGSLKIYCKAKQKPNGWDSRWNPDHRPVKWGV